MLRRDDLPPRDVLSALPIFPLPNVVLLPGMVLPLNVFEPRYLELVDHVLAGGRHIGVPLLRPGYEADYEGRPPIEPVFGIGRLLAHHRIPDGRRFIRLEGLGRVRLARELPARRSFREVEVVPLAEEEPEDREAIEILRAQIERIAALCPDDGEMIGSLLSIPDPRIFAYAVSALLPSLDLLLGAPIGSSSRCPQVDILQRSLAAESTDARIKYLVERTGGAISGLARSQSLGERLLN